MEARLGLPTAGQLRSLILSSKINDVDTARKFPVAGDGSIDWNRPYNVARRWNQERAIFLSGFVDDAHQLENFRESFFASDRSIDWFVRRRAEFSYVARIQLAAALLMCEQGSNLHGDWYRTHPETLIPADPEELPPSKLSIITFNYDRSFEQFFRRALLALGLPPERVDAIFGRIRVEHVYGQIGSLAEVPCPKPTKISASRSATS